MFQGLLSQLWVSLVAQNPGKESSYNVGDAGSTPGLGRSPREGNSYPLQYSGLENSMDHIVHGVAKSQTRLRDFHFTSLHRDNKQVSGFQGLVGNKGFRTMKLLCVCLFEKYLCSERRMEFNLNCFFHEER